MLESEQHERVFNQGVKILIIQGCLYSYTEEMRYATGITF